MIDGEVLDRVLGASYVASAEKLYGSAGANAVVTLLTAVREMYQSLDPALLDAACVAVAVEPGSSIRSDAPERTEPNLRFLPALVSGQVFLHKTDTGTWNVWTTPADLSASGVDHVAYHFRRPGDEIVVVGGVEYQVPQLERGVHSQFSEPTFFDLDEALTDYEFRYARHSQCEILATAWRTPERLMFKPKPEDVMQKSLHNHLQHRLRGNPTPRSRREIHQDIGERVDIEVSWPLTNRVAIIEI